MPSPQQEASSSGSAADCRPVFLKLSYELKLRLKIAGVSIPGHVEGSGEFCLVDSLPISSLPFGQGLGIVSGIPKVDAVLAERLASLKGFPVRQMLTVKRQIEGGEEVSATWTLALSDFRATEMPQDRFDVPRGYRYQEPSNHWTDSTRPLTLSRRSGRGMHNNEQTTARASRGGARC